MNIVKIKLHRGDFGWWFAIDYNRSAKSGRMSMVYDGCRMHSIVLAGLIFQLWEGGKDGEV